MKRRKRRQRAFSLTEKKKTKKQKAGEKNTNEEKRILLKNGYFSPLWGSQRRVYISKLIENDE